MEDVLNAALLYDFYGELLTEKQRQVFELSVLSDLSLGEVSSLLNITRQAVKYTLDNTINAMLKLESELKILTKFDKLKAELSSIKNITNDDSIKIKIDDILEGI